MFIVVVIIVFYRRSYCIEREMQKVLGKQLLKIRLLIN